MLSVTLSASASQDLADAVEWYARQSVYNAQRFVAEYERIEALVAESPERWAMIAPGVRRLVFRRFPYSLIYSVQSDHVIIIAVKHHARKPGI
jgi:toxin ParE1/3/4